MVRCQFICDPLIETEDICYCIDDIKESKKYICAQDDAKCLNHFCVGFKCNNGECRRNNVRCNDIDDCGDDSDEDDCEQICPSTEHLCMGKCISNSKICPDFDYEYPETFPFSVSNQMLVMEDSDDSYDNYSRLPYLLG
ncbi:Low-density lipoprotein receptor-related protein 4 [Thelohanellus kitauei]|uniref:Low-density lipoprotein receptor-related protein 4 n=1 Tax=Thelohanellus kitauei TaxID=669202 RepID=A0A0C2IMN0_THEKT|nr:Low-density lipoprotein receptor-related protein 4 [Thelohanellus kitauei]